MGEGLYLHLSRQRQPPRRGNKGQESLVLSGSNLEGSEDAVLPLPQQHRPHYHPFHNYPQTPQDLLSPWLRGRGEGMRWL